MELSGLPVSRLGTRLPVAENSHRSLEMDQIVRFLFR